MKKTDAIAYFGNRSALARAARVSPAAVTQWGELIPLATASRLEKLTGGALALDIGAYDEAKDRAPPAKDRAA